MYSFDNCENDTAENDQQEEIHQEEQKGSSHGALRLCYKVSEENRIPELVDPFRGIEKDFEMPYDYQHEPAERYAGVHVSEHLVALP